MGRGGDIGPGEEAVAIDIGEDEGRHPGIGKAQGQIQRRDLAGLGPAPSTATRPPRASTPTAIRPGWRRQASRTRTGSLRAAVPRTIRATPASSQASRVAASRMPPPSWQGMRTAERIASTARRFMGLPAKAPSRSTRWSHPRRPRRSARLVGGIAAVDRGLPHLATAQPHDCALLQIDGGDKIIGAGGPFQNETVIFDLGGAVMASASGHVNPAFAAMPRLRHLGSGARSRSGDSWTRAHGQSRVCSMYSISRT